MLTTLLIALPFIKSFDAEPKQFFAFEEKSVLFQVEVFSQEPEPKLGLVQVSEDGKLVRFLGVLNDEGVLGDKKAKDHVFSRKLFFKEGKAGLLRMFVIKDEEHAAVKKGEPVPESLIVSSVQSLSIEPRPTFFDLLKESYKSIFKKN